MNTSVELSYTPKSDAKFRINTYTGHNGKDFFRISYKERFSWKELEQLLIGHWECSLNFGSEAEAQNFINSINSEKTITA